MKALFIGGTGTISSEITARCVRKGWQLTLLNRGHAPERVPEGVRVLVGDIHQEDQIRALLARETFDAVADFIAFSAEDVERDIRLFEGRTGQYFFISSASVYQKPLSMPWITEGTPLHNPYWEYSRKKAACEQILMQAWNARNFPVTVIRPSHTYCQRGVPVCFHGPKGSFQVLERMRQGKKIIVPGDGTTLWTVTHSRDFAVAFEGLMGNAHAIGEVFHITGDESMTWNQIHECIGKALGVTVRPLHIATDTVVAMNPSNEGALIGDKCNTVLFDNTKIKRIVPEFVTTTSFSVGARECVDYIYSHPECQVPDPAFDAWCDQVVSAYEAAVATFPRF